MTPCRGLRPPAALSPAYVPFDCAANNVGYRDNRAAAAHVVTPLVTRIPLNGRRALPPRHCRPGVGDAIQTGAYRISGLVHAAQYAAVCGALHHTYLLPHPIYHASTATWFYYHHVSTRVPPLVPGAAC